MYMHIHRKLEEGIRELDLVVGGCERVRCIYIDIDIDIDIYRYKYR